MAESVKEVLNETKRREWFNEFWTLYPNPREKQTCWLNFYRMFEEETHRRIMKAVEQQIEQDENFTKENGRFALASHKYLADRQWEVWERKQKAGYPGRPDLGTYEERVARRLAEEQSKQQKEFENMIAESSRRLAEKEKGKKR